VDLPEVRERKCSCDLDLLLHPAAPNDLHLLILSMICPIHRTHFGRGFAGKGRRRCYQCERENMTELDPEKITAQQRFNRVQEDLGLIYSRLKETADELQDSRSEVAALKAQIGAVPEDVHPARATPAQLSLITVDVQDQTERNGLAH